LEKRAEQVLPRSKGVGDERKGAGGRERERLKQCMHI
jgi:hypothetical protein